MQSATTECTTSGSAAECNAGLRCWGTICYPDSDSFSCDGTCDEVRECEIDSDCGDGMICEDNFCQEPPCTATSCPEGLICAPSGNCIADVGTVPPGPVPDCSGVADWMCEGSEGTCGDVEQFLPEQGHGYWNYPLNGETSGNQYRSYARRDLIMLVKYAAAQVECLTSGWSFGNHEPLGLGDMSEANGDIPGTSDGDSGHPEGTHVDGYDMDIAYFRIGASDNRLRSICNSRERGVEQYHCVEPPTSLDLWRSALFIAFFHDSPQLRVMGVDGQVGPMVELAIDRLCSAGWYSGPACDPRTFALAYEVVDEGWFWFRFHHHHMHVSLTTRAGWLPEPHAGRRRESIAGWASTRPVEAARCVESELRSSEVTSAWRALPFRSDAAPRDAAPPLERGLQPASATAQLLDQDLSVDSLP